MQDHSFILEMADTDICALAENFELKRFEVTHRHLKRHTPENVSKNGVKMFSIGRWTVRGGGNLAEHMSGVLSMWPPNLKWFHEMTLKLRTFKVTHPPKSVEKWFPKWPPGGDVYQKQ